LIDISVSASVQEQAASLTVWIDTAFNSGLVIPRTQIAALGLKKASSTEAILADGQLIELETYTCWIEWFGKTYRTQVIENDGQFL